MDNEKFRGRIIIKDEKLVEIPAERALQEEKKDIERRLKEENLDSEVRRRLEDRFSEISEEERRRRENIAPKKSPSASIVKP